MIPQSTCIQFRTNINMSRVFVVYWLLVWMGVFRKKFMHQTYSGWCWPLQMINLAYPDRIIYNKITIQFNSLHLGSLVVAWFAKTHSLKNFIYNKRTSQFSLVHLGSMVVVFLLCIGYWCEWLFFEKKFMHETYSACLVKNAVPTVKKWPLQNTYLAYLDRTICNKITIQFSCMWLSCL
jgi:hypothetical protein